MLKLQPAARPEAGPVLTKAAIRAADQLRLTARVLAAILGVSEATVSRMKRGDFALAPGTKPFERAPRPPVPLPRCNRRR